MVDRHGGDAGGVGRELQAVGGEVAVERGDVGRADSGRSREDQRVSRDRQRCEVRRAGEVAGPVRVARVIGAPRPADDVTLPVDEVQEARREAQGLPGVGGGEVIIQAGGRDAEDVVGGVQRAGADGQEVVRPGAEGAQGVEVQRDRGRDGRGAGEAEHVVDAGGAEIEAQRAAVGQREAGDGHGSGGAVIQIEHRIGGHGEGAGAGRGEAEVERTRADGHVTTVEIGRPGDDDGAKAGLGQVGRRGRHDAALQIEDAGGVRHVERGAAAADGHRLIGDQVRSAGARVAQGAAVEREGVGRGRVAELVGRGESQGTPRDAGHAGIGISLGEGHGVRRGLVQADRAREDGVDRAVAQVVGGGGSQHAGGAGDDAAAERHRSDGVIEGRDVERPVRGDGHTTGVGQHVVGAEREGAVVHVGAAGVGIGSGKRERARAGLGEAARGIGHRSVRHDGGRHATSPKSADKRERRGAGVAHARITDDHASDLTKRPAGGVEVHHGVARGPRTVAAELHERCAEVAAAADQAVHADDAAAGRGEDGLGDGDVVAVRINRGSSRVDAKIIDGGRDEGAGGGGLKRATIEVDVGESRRRTGTHGDGPGGDRAAVKIEATPPAHGPGPLELDTLPGVVEDPA